MARKKTAARRHDPNTSTEARRTANIDSVKHADARVLESDSRFRLLADSAPVLIWVDDADGHRFANRAYCEFVGATDEAMQGQGWRHLIHPEDRERYLAAYRDAAARNAPFATQVRFRRADGAYHWMKCDAVPRAAGLEFQGFVGSQTDITDLKEAEAALVRADQSKNEFLAMLAHELRNPLAPLRNLVHIFKTEGLDGATFDWAVGTLDRQVRTMSLLVDDLLDVSRVTQGKVTLRSEPTDLCEAGRRVLIVDDNVDASDALAVLLRLRGHEVTIAYDGRAALEAAAAFQPDVILLDIGLSGESGYDVMRDLGANRVENRPLVIAVTGYGGMDARYRAREAGFDHYLTKPLDLDVLLGLIAA